MENSTCKSDLARTLGDRDDHPLPDASFESVLAHFIEKREAGQPVRLDELVASFPQHAEPLRSFAANQQWLEPHTNTFGGVFIGECFDDFLLTREIARGGMGTVYAAIQQSLRREVAVKFISDGLLADSNMKLRFRIEAEAAAALSHPNILSIHAIGCWRGMDYFVMPLVSGESLQANVVRRHLHLERISSDSRAKRTDAEREHLCTSITQVRDIARAVAYAHRRGIIHRDIKPDNVLIGNDGQPKIVDFGLAKWHRDEPGMTRDGQIIGTPHYMSPEQARGESDVTAATDIYSLGGILFAILTGQPPHQGRSTAEVLGNVLRGETPSLRLTWPGGMPRYSELADVEHVLARTMAHDPTRRYRSADDLADDLSRILAGESPHVVPDGIFSKVSRELMRDQHQDTFANWGRALIQIGILVFVAHLLMFGVAESMTPETRQSMSASALSTASLLGYFVPRIVMLVGIGWTIHYARDGCWMPRGVAERPVWSIWLGYLAALTMVNVLWAARFFDHADVMVLAALMSGFGFLAMAGHLWGGNAIAGGIFLLIAVLNAFWPRLSPLLLGSGWLIAMWILSRRYT